RLYSTNRYLNVTFCCSSTKLTLGAQTERTLAPATGLLLNSATGWQNKAVVTTYSWRSQVKSLTHMREVSKESKRISTARHRATPEKGATLEAMTQFMGRSGRQAAVIAAAYGMVLAATPAANAAPVQTDRETSTLPATIFKLERTSRKAEVVTADSVDPVPY